MRGSTPRGPVFGKPIFPGTSTMNQLERITSLVGCTSRELVQDISPFSQTMPYDDSNKSGA